MNIFKNTFFALIVLLIVSCGNNDELIDIENSNLIPENIELYSKGKTEIKEISVSITVNYKVGTNETEKQLYRSEYLPIFGFFNVVVCPNNPNYEIWEIESISLPELESKTGDLEQEDDIDKVDLSNTCF